MGGPVEWDIDANRPMSETIALREGVGDPLPTRKMQATAVEDIKAGDTVEVIIDPNLGKHVVRPVIHE